MLKGYFSSSSHLQIKRLHHKKIRSSLWNTEHPEHMQIIKTSEKENHSSNFPQTSGCFFEKQMFIELDLGGGLIYVLIAEDEGKPRDAKAPSWEVQSSLAIFLFLFKMGVFLPI